MIEVGSWVTTQWGPAICTSISEKKLPVPPEGEIGQPPIKHRYLCQYKYEAYPWRNGEPVPDTAFWVENGDFLAEEGDIEEWFVYPKEE